MWASVPAQGGRHMAFRSEAEAVRPEQDRERKQPAELGPLCPFGQLLFIPEHASLHHCPRYTMSDARWR